MKIKIKEREFPFRHERSTLNFLLVRLEVILELSKRVTLYFLNFDVVNYKHLVS